MKLFYKPGACSLASHITLQESGKDFTLNGVDLMKKRLENGDDFFAINPKGQVPALLLDDGTLLTEGVAIMQFLADAVPDRQLLAPTGSVARYKTLAATASAIFIASVPAWCGRVSLLHARRDRLKRRRDA
jgi:glutathione S-transferase